MFKSLIRILVIQQIPTARQCAYATWHASARIQMILPLEILYAGWICCSSHHTMWWWWFIGIQLCVKQNFIVDPRSTLWHSHLYCRWSRYQNAVKHHMDIGASKLPCLYFREIVIPIPTIKASAALEPVDQSNWLVASQDQQVNNIDISDVVVIYSVQTSNRGVLISQHQIEYVL